MGFRVVRFLCIVYGLLPTPSPSLPAGMSQQNRVRYVLQFRGALFSTMTRTHEIVEWCRQWGENTTQFAAVGGDNAEEAEEAEAEDSDQSEEEEEEEVEGEEEEEEEEEVEGKPVFSGRIPLRQLRKGRHNFRQYT